jgi:hypothetical protein
MIGVVKYMQLECKPDFDMAVKRIYAWFEGEIIDRAPVRFTAHNAEFELNDYNEKYQWRSLKEKWFDAEYQVEHFIRSIKGKRFYGETFPVFWPNLGPDVFASFYGCQLDFGEVTSWSEPCLKNWDDAASLKLDMDCQYFKKIEELMQYALERCTGKFMVGYTDLHPGLDCIAAWMGSQNLCMDLYDHSSEIKTALELANTGFQKVYGHFDKLLKQNNQLSVTWMGIPSFEKMHIPSCDFSTMISSEHFVEYYLPVLQKEVKQMTHNVFHLDGKGVARHLDYILEVPEITAIQWVQGVGNDKPIMQWIPLIKNIQSTGKSVVVDLDKSELEGFISEVSPEGILLCVASDNEEEQKDILKRIEKW